MLATLESRSSHGPTHQRKVADSLTPIFADTQAAMCS